MLISSILLILTSNAVTLRRDKSILYSRVVITILICCFVLCLNSYHIEFQSKGLGLFSGLYNVTTTTHVFHMFVLLITGIILLFNAFYSRNIWTENYSSLYRILTYKMVYFNSFVVNKMSEQFKIIEYPLIILFVLIGGMFLISSSDLISIFLAIELQSYGLYILCAVYRNSERATSGALTYFLLGGLSSCFILLGSALLYSNSGNTSFDGLYIINNISNSTKSIYDISELSVNNLSGLPIESYYINLSLVILSVGFLFKISAAPFHNWSPDVYDAIPTIVTTFVAVFAKISILILLLEIVHYTTNYGYNESLNIYVENNNLTGSSTNYSWTFGILISSFLSLIIGSTLGLTQFRIKRLYAYSTISHIGFLLLALVINTVESVQSFLFYLMQYSLSNLNAFFLLLCIGYYSYLYVEKKDNKGQTITSKISDKNNSPIQLINQIKGYFHINSFLAISLAITLFSFVGIPPLIGFFAKQMVLSSALDNGYIFMSLIAILTSVVSAFYYLAIVKQMFFEKSDYMLNPKLNNLTYRISIINRFNSNTKFIYLNAKNIHVSSSLSITTSILTLVILLFILIPQEWLNMANILALIMFN